jgi:uncharacterized protein YhbP (UPF0306 family)
MTREELEDIVKRYMDSFTTMTLASCTDRKPWVAAVYYARHGFDLVFFSSPRSIHASMFAQNPIAAAEIHGEYERWQEIKGLQMEGRVEKIVSPVSLTLYTTTYLRRYPFVRELFSGSAAQAVDITAQMSRVGMYVFRPESIRYLDNQGGFGNRWKLDIVDGKAIGNPVRDGKSL